MVVDLFGFRLSVIHRLRTCIQNIYALNKELELYDEDLLDRPCILLLNKIDEEGAQSEYDQIKEKILDLKCKYYALNRVFPTNFSFQFKKTDRDYIVTFFCFNSAHK